MATIDSLIRDGKIERARAALRRECEGRIPRARRGELASLARRAGLPSLSLRLLNRAVRGRRDDATEPERAQYAAALTAVGAPDEALEILTALNGARDPDVLLFTAFARIARWDYAAAIPLLERYVATTGLPAYARLVGRVNLAAALAYERREDEAARLLRELLRETSGRLRANTLELLAQIATRAGRWDEARGHVAAATAILGDAGGLDSLFVRKWGAVADFLEHGSGALAKIRAEALAVGHWETVRDCDLVRAEASGDRAALLHLYFGTPHASFRNRITPLAVPAEYRWTLRGRARRTTTWRLDADGVVGKLFATLTSDFYRPLRLAAVHAALYPGEYFNPVSSPARVHQVMKRARRFLVDKKLPIEIAETRGRYSLSATAECSLLVGAARVSRDATLIAQLHHAYGRLPFGAAEAARTLHAPRRTTSRLLSRAEESGVLARSGQSSATRFHFLLPRLSV